LAAIIPDALPGIKDFLNRDRLQKRIVAMAIRRGCASSPSDSFFAARRV
jgi:hypothetical protein